MSKKRGIIEEQLRRIIYGGKCSNCTILVIDRRKTSGYREIPVNAVSRVSQSYLILKDGTLIPLHRVLGVKDENGNIVWKR
ncbi:MAG TPA: DUF504 domain-containing protein [Pyrodictiaceae archaeon]|nr:DUF504 domain-containing protein [Pyrodictiaceae archaeon]HIQ10824.1 DUF504 domain-containing protein [Pyrodictium sp.]HIQ56120.1 DUF504 domain-containing protein [Pyrodictium sp.]